MALLYTEPIKNWLSVMNKSKKRDPKAVLHSHTEVQINLLD